MPLTFNTVHSSTTECFSCTSLILPSKSTSTVLPQILNMYTLLQIKILLSKSVHTYLGHDAIQYHNHIMMALGKCPKFKI